MRRLWDIPAGAPRISPAPGHRRDRRWSRRWRPTASRWRGSSRPTRWCSPARRSALRGGAAPRGAGDRPGRLPPDQTGRARACHPARRPMGREGWHPDQQRAARRGLMRRMVDPPGDALPDWEIFARVGRALGHQRAVRLEECRRGPRRVRRDDRGAALRSERALARAPGAGGAAAVADPGARVGRHRPQRLGAAVYEPSLSDAQRSRAAGGHPRMPSRPSAERRASAGADHRPRRPSVAHGDAHVQGQGLACRRARAVSWRSIRRTRGGRASRDGDKVLLLGPRARDRARASNGQGLPRASRSRRFTGVALHLEPGAGALNAVVGRAIDPTSNRPS